jgi:hypothetical protein
VVSYAFSLVLAFFAGSLLHTHAALWAPFVFIPGVGLAVLSPFIWFGAHWAMFLALLIGVALLGVHPWFFLIIPVTLGMLTLVHAIARVSDGQRIKSFCGALADAETRLD